jgi:hypothetical protein
VCPRSAPASADESDAVSLVRGSRIAQANTRPSKRSRSRSSRRSVEIKFQVRPRRKRDRAGRTTGRATRTSRASPSRPSARSRPSSRRRRTPRRRARPSSTANRATSTSRSASSSRSSRSARSTRTRVTCSWAWVPASRWRRVDSHALDATASLHTGAGRHGRVSRRRRHGPFRVAVRVLRPHVLRVLSFHRQQQRRVVHGQPRAVRGLRPHDAQELHGRLVLAGGAHGQGLGQHHRRSVQPPRQPHRAAQHGRLLHRGPERALFEHGRHGLRALGRHHGRRRACARRRPVWKSKFYGAFSTPSPRRVRAEFTPSTRRVRPESSRRPPRHRRAACSMA